MSNWIKCSDKLPEADGDFIATNCYGDVISVRYCEGWNNFRKTNGEVFRYYESEPGVIVAWQPMPAPYKANNKGDWRLCEDELPETEGEYIATDFYGDVLTLNYCEGWNNSRKLNGEICRANELEADRIIAWQPMPAKYEEVNE